MACRRKENRDGTEMFDMGSAVILTCCRLGDMDRACVSHFAQAPARLRGHGRRRPRRGSGQACERKTTGKKHAEKWTPGQKTPKIGEMLVSRAIERLPLVHANILLIFIFIFLPVPTGKTLTILDRNGCLCVFGRGTFI